MKYCEEYAALLDPYIDEELSGEEAARVRAHLEECPGCRAYTDAALAIRAAFPEIGETEVPAGFADGVMAAVRGGRALLASRPAALSGLLRPGFNPAGRPRQRERERLCNRREYGSAGRSHGYCL